MRKLAKIIFMLCVVALLNSCDQEALDQINSRLDALENVAIASVNQQISSIKISISSLQETDRELKGYIANLQTTSTELQKAINANNEQIAKVETELKGQITSSENSIKEGIEAAKTELRAELQLIQATMQGKLNVINVSIDSLKKKDGSLETRITELKTYVDNGIKETKEWASATFATLEQYNLTVAEIAQIKTNIETINTTISDLEIRINDKIAKDIKTASDILDAKIAQQAETIISAYTTAVSQAKTEMEAAYVGSIKTAIAILEASMQSWVNDKLTGYYTIAETDEKLATLDTAIRAELAAQHAYFRTAISELSADLVQKVNDNDLLIDSLTTNLTSLQNDAATQYQLIADNAENISANAILIAANAALISNNVNATATNATIIENTLNAVADNEKRLSENKVALTALGFNLYDIAERVAFNAHAIATNAELIAKNASAINNTSETISNNIAEISKLRNEIIAVRQELTEAYTLAITSAINDSEGKLNANLSSEIGAVNIRIDALSSALDALTTRVSAIEELISGTQKDIQGLLHDVATLKEQVTMIIDQIQSVVIIPDLHDGSVYCTPNTNNAFVFEVLPSGLAERLSQTAAMSSFQLRVAYTGTKSFVEYVNMPISSISASGDQLRVVASGNNIDDAFFEGTMSACASLRIDSGASSYATAFFPLFAVPEKLLTAKYSQNKTNWANDIPASFSTLYVKGSLNLETLQTIRSSIDKQTSAVALDLSQSEYTSAAFPAVFGSSIEEGASANLSSIKFPSNITEIAENAFYNCSGLETVNLNGIAKIGGNAFRSTGLKTLTVPASVTEYTGTGAFSYCWQLEELHYYSSAPNTVSGTATDLYIFAMNNKAEYDELPEIYRVGLIPLTAYFYEGSVIPTYCFATNHKLTKVVFKGVPAVTGNAWLIRCRFLDTVDCRELTSDYTSGGGNSSNIGVKAIGDKKILVPDGKYANFNAGLWKTLVDNNGFEIVVPLYVPGATAQYSADGSSWTDDIPASFSALYAKGALNAADLASIKTAIEAQSGPVALNLSQATYESTTFPAVFNGTASGTNRNASAAIIATEGTKISSMVFPSNVTAIAESAFRACAKLVSVSLDGIVSIGGSAFANTGLISVTVPASVTSCGSYAFAYCPDLETIVWNSPATNNHAVSWRGAADNENNVASKPTVVTFGPGANLGTGQCFDTNHKLVKVFFAGDPASVGSGWIIRCTSIHTFDLSACTKANGTSSSNLGAVGDGVSTETPKVIIVPDALKEDFDAAVTWKYLVENKGFVIKGVSEIQ